MSTQCWDMTHAPWQGVLVYSRPVGWAELGAGQQEGVYIYPDWAACVRGVWANHTLVLGKYQNKAWIWHYPHPAGVHCSIERVAMAGPWRYQMTAQGTGKIEGFGKGN